ncbi:ATP-binding cassette domain-containing protein [Rhodoferax sp.]|uniref:ATP-binding cassette domain-containing protein n=1 Tax=Rhodoferax sp. TaxID=50421 RepID=UPI00272F2376|nr:ATP-binding cassette domain-containing protein [Rhodoferax sp.]MDP2442809.1 ATP-binding cassette domain-containing protein [Rhodoferax sp.]
MSGLPHVAPWPALNVQAPACFDLRDVEVRLGPAGRLAALSDVTLQIASGERVALVGANGSGKSTLLRTLHGLQRAQAGTLSKPAHQREAMLFQRPHMLRLSAQNNIALSLWLQGVPWAQARERALLALARVDMQDLAGRNARALSGGQQQRLALARAWALMPDVWLLDEPTASLDPHAKREVEALIDAFASGPEAMTLVFASHNLGQVKRLASRVIYLEHGRVLADLPVEDFFSGPLLQQQYPAAHFFVKGELV